ncbi:hypothetical protein CHH58_05190 [Terribacillus saccharophilus]|uniref:hypothetical protein n=1 Tax=Terribacillus saccharophilus TaxID=361277 RepID=UPI000BA4FFFE|nr:hypothetical protein [Terribacillus saccharophilus]PAF38820.1 hypothetical protein CHH58_05190 [Terribacillus saccharophilus]
MTVSEMIELLKKCNQESEIKVLFPFPNRPTGGQLEDIYGVKSIIDQDSNKIHYTIDTGIGEEGRYRAYISNKGN